jgi:hypothetical protein
MKNLNTKLVILLAGLSLFAAGCSGSGGFQSKASAVSAVSTTTSTTDTTTSTTTTTGASQVTFTPVSIDEMNSYVGLHPLNNPTNFQISIVTSNTGNGRYGGTVKISYTDTGVYYESNMQSGTGTNVSLDGLQDNGTQEDDYNRWFSLNGQSYFSGFFQDSYGAIIVVIDGVVNQGDAQGTSLLSGSVYYKNFAQSYATQSPYRKCWFIRAGPYNCRAAAVTDKTSVYPTDNGYRKLGTFSGISTSLSFQN